MRSRLCKVCTCTRCSWGLIKGYTPGHAALCIEWVDICTDLCRRLAGVMPRCASAPPAITHYRNATTAASDLLSGRVVVVFVRNNESIEPRPGK